MCISVIYYATANDEKQNEQAHCLPRGLIHSPIPANYFLSFICFFLNCCWISCVHTGRPPAVLADKLFFFFLQRPPSFSQHHTHIVYAVYNVAIYVNTSTTNRSILYIYILYLILEIGCWRRVCCCCCSTQCVPVCVSAARYRRLCKEAPGASHSLAPVCTAPRVFLSFLF